MIEGVIQRRAQTAGAAVERVGDDIGQRRSRVIHRRHPGAIAGAQNGIILHADHVQKLRVGRQWFDGVQRRIHRKRVARVVHDGQEIVRRFVLRIGEDDKIGFLARNDVVGQNRHERRAVGALMLMHQAERVAEFVANGRTIPRSRADGKTLRPADHSNVGLPAFLRRVFKNQNIIRFGGARREMQVGKHRPFRHAIEKGFLLGDGDIVAEGVIYIAAGPGRETAGERGGSLHTSKLVPPRLQIGNGNQHVADLRGTCARGQAGEQLIEHGHTPRGIIGARGRGRQDENGKRQGNCEEEMVTPHIRRYNMPRVPDGQMNSLKKRCLGSIGHCPCDDGFMKVTGRADLPVSRGDDY